jgi:hypothetical protein
VGQPGADQAGGPEALLENGVEVVQLRPVLERRKPVFADYL